jgi:hypothetical protein
MSNPYPRDSELEKIAKWETQFKALMEYVQGLWEYDEYFGRRGRTYTLHTGGWSGNEDLIGAMQRNVLFWSLCWVSSRCGGHYTFRIPKGVK